MDDIKMVEAKPPLIKNGGGTYIGKEGGKLLVT